MRPFASSPLRVLAALLLAAGIILGGAVARAQAPGDDSPAPTTEVAPEEDAPEAETGAPALPPGGLGPQDVIVVANSNEPASTDLAQHYMKVRGIPESHLLLTGAPLTDSIGRDAYERQIAEPLRSFMIKQHLERARCVVLVYGMPLKVLQPIETPAIHQSVVLIQDERQTRLTETLKALSALAGLGNAEQRPTSPALALDPAKPAAEQLRDLRDTAMQAFQKGAETVRAAKTATRRADLQKQWLALWKDVFGATPPPEGWLDLPAETQAARQDRLVALRRLQSILGTSSTPDLKELRAFFDLLHTQRGAVGVIELSDGLARRIKPDGSWGAAVDSELATVLWPGFPLARYQPNPLALDFHGEATMRTLMVCRLDGPDPATVRRMIDVSAAVEKTGLDGKAYIDARGLSGGGPYGDYDHRLTALGGLLEDKTAIATTLDTHQALFQPGDCPDTALYVGWYKLGQYVDAFEFVPGAVGFHIASSEAVTLHARNNTKWCAQLLAHGCVATLGPVNEPYLTAFPDPEQFFGLLLTGKYTLAECYWLTSPFVSWQMTLIGDPLYNPYKAKPALKVEDLEAALAE